jgi:SAM-dependent methyltransferase
VRAGSPFAGSSVDAMSDAIEFTGERFVPGAAGEIWYEHWHRYLFAAPMVAGREVLDIACGEGYGSALLARRASRVTGADIAPAAIAHARSRYAGRPNLEFCEADCAALPFADASFDVVVSFETIEHIAAQESFLDEIARVLRPDGFVVLSCPNKVEYSDKRGHVNAFHVRELYREELAALVTARFSHAAWYGQRPGFFSIVWPEAQPAGAEIFEVSENTADAPTPGHARPLYFIVVAGRSAEAIHGPPPRLSVLADRDEWIYRDYENVTRAFVGAQQQGGAQGGELVAARAAAAAALLDRDRAAAERAEFAAQVAAQREEIAKRASFRWWIGLPLRRLLRALRGMPPGG